MTRPAPVMTLYLVAQGMDKRGFLGTDALFYFRVNVRQAFFGIGLGLARLSPADERC